MAKLTLTGFDEYYSKLERLGAESENVCKKAVYQGAKVLADQISDSINSLPAVKEVDNLKAYKSGEKSQLSIAQKKGLKDGLGIAPFKIEGGAINTSIGFDGYNSIKTKKYPNGQPNQLIARVVESGSSYMDKKPFIRPSVNQAKTNVINAMKEVIDEEFNKIMEG